MSIRLKYLLEKNKATLEKFCTQNDITDYDLLVSFCKIKMINCDIDQKEFLEIFPKETKDEDVAIKKEVKKDEQKTTKSKKPSTQTRRRGRKPKVEKVRVANTKNDT
tara:strand:- start:852 stop:1172 length:321 start_codon:yes stop_codon:yes gene_type:complete